jgi:hypothetical protein
MLTWLGEYRDTIRAYVANGTAATQARTPDGVHYLRTTNPQNPENLAVYPRRIGSNRRTPYLRPRGFDDLDRGGLLSFDTRHCRNGNPNVADAQQLAERCSSPCRSCRTCLRPARRRRIRSARLRRTRTRSPATS